MGNRKAQKEAEPILSADRALHILNLIDAFRNSHGDCNKSPACAHVLKAALDEGAISTHFLMINGALNKDAIRRLKNGHSTGINPDKREVVFALITSACNSALELNS